MADGCPDCAARAEREADARRETRHALGVVGDILKLVPQLAAAHGRLTVLSVTPAEATPIPEKEHA